MKKIAYLLFALFGLISCKQEQQTATPETMDIEKELALLEQTRSTFTAAIREGRYGDIAAVSTKDIITVPPGSPGHLAMFALGEQRGRFPYDSIAMAPKETVIVNDSVAYDFGISKTYYTDEAGQVVELQNTFLAILKKQDGTWKLHREVASAVVGDK